MCKQLPSHTLVMPQGTSWYRWAALVAAAGSIVCGVVGVVVWCLDQTKAALMTTITVEASSAMQQLRCELRTLTSELRAEMQDLRSHIKQVNSDIKVRHQEGELRNQQISSGTPVAPSTTPQDHQRCCVGLTLQQVTCDMSNQ